MRPEGIIFYQYIESDVLNGLLLIWKLYLYRKEEAVHVLGNLGLSISDWSRGKVHLSLIQGN